MIDLNIARTEDLLPPNFRTELDIRISASEIKAFCYAVDQMDALVFARLLRTVTWSGVMEAPEELNAYMASELRTPFFDPNLPLDTKRLMVFNTLEWYAHLGAKEVIEDIIRMLYGSGDITEWFDFGGEPGVFRISVLDSLKNRTEFDAFIALLWWIKNTRSWLERIVVKQQSSAQIYIGSAVHHKKNFSIPAERTKIQPITVHTGIVTRHTRRFVIPSNKEKDLWHISQKVS